VNFQTRFLRLAFPLFVFFCVAVVAGGCSYKSEIRQGHEQVLENIDNVKVGMSKSEVTELLGSGQAKPFTDDVWVYVFRLRESGFLGAVRLLSAELVFDGADMLTAINIVRNDFNEQ